MSDSELCNRVSGDKSRLFVCSRCPYITNRSNNLKRHFRKMHEITSGNFECCDTKFADKAQLRHHTATCHSEGYACNICRRVFCRRALLRRHQSVHSGYKEFCCPVCSYATSHKSNLERHARVHEYPSAKTVTTPSRMNPILARLLQQELPLQSPRSAPGSPSRKLSHSIDSILTPNCDSSSLSAERNDSATEGKEPSCILKHTDTRWPSGFSLTAAQTETLARNSDVSSFSAKTNESGAEGKEPSCILKHTDTRWPSGFSLTAAQTETLARNSDVSSFSAKTNESGAEGKEPSCIRWPCGFSLTLVQTEAAVPKPSFSPSLSTKQVTNDSTPVPADDNLSSTYIPKKLRASRRYQGLF